MHVDLSDNFQPLPSYIIVIFWTESRFYFTFSYRVKILTEYVTCTKSNSTESYNVVYVIRWKSNILKYPFARLSRECNGLLPITHSGITREGRPTPITLERVEPVAFRFFYGITRRNLPLEWYPHVLLR